MSAKSNSFWGKKSSAGCRCPIRKDSVYKDTYNEFYGNVDNFTPVDVLILDEFKEPINRRNILLNIIKKYFGNVKYGLIHSLGCTCFKMQDTVSIYSMCKKKFVKTQRA